MKEKTKNSYYHDNRWKSLFFLCVGLMIISIDNTILNVALPQIAVEFEATLSQLQWIVDAYILVFAALLLTTGSIGDRIGRKKILQLGIVWLAGFSALATQATSPEMLSVIRALMGIGGAMIMPSTLSIITATFRDNKERSQAIAIWAATFGLGVGIGPIAGGWLIEHFDWSAVFLINVPVAAFALIGGYYYIQDSQDENAPKSDWIGVILSILGLFGLVYAIIEAGIHSWTAPHVINGFVAAAVLLTIFTWWENRNPHAMLPIKFFKNMSFTGANTALALATFSMMGAMFFMTQYFQSVQGYNALDAGLRVLPMALVIMVTAASSAKISERMGIKVTVSLGLFLASAGLFFLAQYAQADTPYSTIFIGLGIMGTGIGLAMPPATDSVMGSIPVDKAGVGSAMNDTTRQLGGALGIAILGTLMNSTYLEKIVSIKEAPLFQTAISLRSEEEAQMMVTAIESSIQGAHRAANMITTQVPDAMKAMGEQLSNLIITTSNDAFLAGMSDALVVGAAIIAISAALTLILLPSRIRPPEGQTAPSVGHGGYVPEAEPVPVPTPGD